MIRHAPSIGIGIGLSLRSQGAAGAAFSGLLDQYPGAAAAYSLRALSSGWLAGDVVEVRPSSGWTPASFTAGQVANGEMVDYVKRPGNFTNSGLETFTNNGTGDGFTATNTVAAGICRSSTVSGGSGSSVFITFDLSLVSGSPSLNLRQGIGSPVSNSEIFTTSGSKSATLTATGNFDNFTFGDGDIPSEFTVSNVRVSTNDGFVTIWYDQSGNASDATQATTTKQPKIVSAGALVVGGIDFDGVDDELDMPFSLGVNSGFLFPSVVTPNSLHTGSIVEFRDINDDGARTITAASGSVITSTDAVDALEAYTAAKLLFTGKYDGVNVTSFVNGVAGASESGVNVNNATNGRIGDAFDGGLPFSGQIDEVIIYNTDQSGNRVGIETNINAAYSIF